MVFFPLWFFQALVYGALAICAAGAAALLWMLFRDLQNEEIW